MGADAGRSRRRQTHVNSRRQSGAAPPSAAHNVRETSHSPQATKQSAPFGSEGRVSYVDAKDIGRILNRCPRVYVNILGKLQSGGEGALKVPKLRHAACDVVRERIE